MLPRWSGIFRVLGRIRPAERSVATGAFLTLFGFTTGHALLETARDALFLGRLPATRLPWVYLAIALMALLAAEYQGRLLRRFSSRNELSGWLLFAGVVTGGFWVALSFSTTWIFYALYVWTGVLATLVVVRFWTQLGSLFTVTQAKRIYAFVGSGSALGSILGAALARSLASWFPPSTLVATAALVFVVASPAPRLLDHRRLGHLPRSPGGSSPSELTTAARLIWTRPYLRRVACLVLASTITFTLVDFVFKATVDRTVPPGELGEFFATVYLTLNTLSFFVQITGVAWLIRRLGVSRAVAIVPGLIILGSLGVSFGGTLAMALILKGIDGSLRHSLSRTGSELFWIPVPSDLRVRAKPLVDTLGQRGGQAIASLIILGLLGVTTSEVPFAALAGVTATAWLFLVIDVRRHYLDVFRSTIDSETRNGRFDLAAVDGKTLETLIVALDDPDERRVLTALDLLEAFDRSSTIPALLLGHPSERVVRRVIQIFARSRRPDIQDRLPTLLSHEDARVRGAALLVAIRLGDETALRGALGDQSRQVRAVAAAGLASLADDPNGPPVSLPDAVDEDPTVRLAAAAAIRERPSSRFDELLFRLVEDPDVRVRRAAIAGLGVEGGWSHAQRLIPYLADRAVRPELRAAFVRMGPRTAITLREALNDESVSHAVRRHLPSAVAAFGSPLAAEVLTDRLLVEPDGMVRFKIVSALGRMRRRDPQLLLDLGALRASVQRTEETALRLMVWRQALDRIEGEPSFPPSMERTLLIGLLKDKQRHAVERLFRLMNLEGSSDDFYRVYQGLESGRPHSIANSCELLEHLIPPRKRPGLYRLVQDLYETDFGIESEEEHRAFTIRATLLELSRAEGESLGELARAVLASEEGQSR